MQLLGFQELDVQAHTKNTHTCMVIVDISKVDITNELQIFIPVSHQWIKRVWICKIRICYMIMILLMCRFTNPNDTKLLHSTPILSVIVWLINVSLDNVSMTNRKTDDRIVLMSSWSDHIENLTFAGNCRVQRKSDLQSVAGGRLYDSVMSMSSERDTKS